MKKLNFLLHSWLGMIFAIVLVAASLSGAAFVFEDEINVLLRPDLQKVEPQAERLSVDGMVAAMKAANPEWQIGPIILPPEEAVDRSVMMRISQPDILFHQAYLDPYSGKYLGKEIYNWRWWMLQIHYAMHLGDWGRVIVFLGGVVMILSSFTGLWMQRGWLKKVWKRWRFERSWRLGFSDLHKAVGWHLIFFNLVLGFTGAWINWAAFERLAAGQPRPIGFGFLIKAYDEPAASYDAMIERAKEAIPGLEPMWITPPREGSGTVSITGGVPGAHSFFGRYANTVTLDAASGEVIEASDIRRATWGAKFSEMIYALHFGQFGGFWVKLIYFVASLGLAAVVVSGCAIAWLRRRKRVA